MEALGLLFVGKKIPEELLDCLKGFETTVLVSPNGYGGRIKYYENPCKIVIIDCPLPDEHGSEFAFDLVENHDCQVMMLVPANQYDFIADKAMENGIAVISKPINPIVMKQSLNMMLASYKKINMIRKQNITLEERMEEIKLISKAKTYLMEMGMKEEEAHRYLQKEAMNRGLKIIQIASEIIRNYE